MDSFELRDCLRLLPTLTRFAMWKPNSEAVIQFFVDLADNPSLLPNLRDLTIHIFATARSSCNMPDHSWQTLVRALSTRRIDQLYIGYVGVSPPPDALASLRTLVASGAKIHVGTEERNFVVA
ncbi:hypothetical protein C8R45DRAFT_1101926 [Mycena sanguinolenta]|nr:hypothetical protein C8R45DRAFT_1101926 [Mycena sanguinolenta]